jgi:hypothetical protein
VSTLNEVFSGPSARRRYEVWFLRMGLVDGSGAWWFRYLLMNPGREGCPGNPGGMPVQVWATWFPAGGKPQSFIQSFPLQGLDVSRRGQPPFHFVVGDNAIQESACCGALHVDGHSISWNLQYTSTFHVTLSSRGWIGFSRTPHSDAVFSGEITFDGRRLTGSPLGFGVQGHNCGYRHRNFWTWTHSYFSSTDHAPTTLEALVYEMPLGMIFRKAVLWHDAQEHVFRNIRETSGSRQSKQWIFSGVSRDGLRIGAAIDGGGPSLHRLPYVKTNCAGDFEVINNSLASASLVIDSPGGVTETLETSNGAVLEMAG